VSGGSRTATCRHVENDVTSPVKNKLALDVPGGNDGILRVMRIEEAELIVYGLKNCDMCRRAMKELIGKGHSPRLVDVRAEPLSGARIDSFLAAFGADLLNRRSTTWRGLSEVDRVRDPAALLADHPALMKRPVIDTGDVLYLGWDAATISALL